MLGIFKDIATRLRRRVARQVQAARLRRERRRFDRLYGPSQVGVMPAEVGAQGHAERLTRIVSDYCQRSQALADAHEAARVKLDAAEYAFSSLLRDLSSVMGDAPSTWTPERAPVRSDKGVRRDLRAVAA